MSHSVRILRSAQRDLTEIAAYLRREAPSTAEERIEEIFQSIDRLSPSPESGPVPRDTRLRKLGFRTLIAGRYLVFYKVTRSLVRIYRVLHQRRAYARML